MNKINKAVSRAVDNEALANMTISEIEGLIVSEVNKNILVKELKRINEEYDVALEVVSNHIKALALTKLYNGTQFIHNEEKYVVDTSDTMFTFTKTTPVFTLNKPTAEETSECFDGKNGHHTSPEDNVEIPEEGVEVPTLDDVFSDPQAIADMIFERLNIFQVRVVINSLKAKFEDREKAKASNDTLIEDRTMVEPDFKDDDADDDIVINSDLKALIKTIVPTHDIPEMRQPTMTFINKHYRTLKELIPNGERWNRWNKYNLLEIAELFEKYDDSETMDMRISIIAFYIVALHKFKNSFKAAGVNYTQLHQDFSERNYDEKEVLEMFNNNNNVGTGRSGKKRHIISRSQSSIEFMKNVKRVKNTYHGRGLV